VARSIDSYWCSTLPWCSYRRSLTRSCLYPVAALSISLGVMVSFAFLIWIYLPLRSAMEERGYDGMVLEASVPRLAGATLWWQPRHRLLQLKRSQSSVLGYFLWYSSVVTPNSTVVGQPLSPIHHRAAGEGLYSS
jgi:hypothetical protein